ncbi:MAG: class I SAM-dependent methyltransferase [Chloroflexi bacterium]|nr:class I SAM-dependent methyltransferase [Chloroflexota bacterium]
MVTESGNGRPAATLPRRRGSLYQRLFARAIASESSVNQGPYEDYRRALLADLHGDVLEIGPGTGPNLPYYSRDVRWIGLEPNPAMFPYVEREAARLGLTIDLREGAAEDLGVPDESLDAVVSTRVLCSVGDPHRALQEIRRALKPGGRFVFIEHVAAPRESALRRFQQIIKPIWRTVGDGCHPDRETWVAIQHAGFSHVHLEHFRVDFPIVGPHIAGVAVK